jgi:lysozyme
VASKRQKAIAAAVLLAAPITASFEGLRTKPYLDPANIPTVCYGETELAMRVYSADECGQMLRARLAKDYAPHILDCLPQVADRPKVFAALLDASYNAGWAAVCKSRMVDAFRSGNDGCALFEGWYVTTRNRKTGVRVTLPGLVRRRKAEAALCSS